MNYQDHYPSLGYATGLTLRESAFSTAKNPASFKKGMVFCRLAFRTWMHGTDLTLPGKHLGKFERVGVLFDTSFDSSQCLT
jgi:hypothetical protein